MREEIHRTGVQIEAGLSTTTLKRPAENWNNKANDSQKAASRGFNSGLTPRQRNGSKKMARKIVLHSHGFEHKNLQAAFLKSSQKQ